MESDRKFHSVYFVYRHGKKVFNLYTRHLQHWLAITANGEITIIFLPYSLHWYEILSNQTEQQGFNNTVMVAINNIAFWDTMRCGLIIIYWCFAGKWKKFCQTICHNIRNHPEKFCLINGMVWYFQILS